MSDIRKQFVTGANRARRAYWRDIRSAWYWIALAPAIAVTRYFSSPHHAGPESLEEGVHEVRRVVDGDTLMMANGARIRLEGIDTPETVKENTPLEPWRPEASQFTKDFVERAGGRVRLTFPLERRDQYDRFLAFVWNGDELLNDELVRAGLARAKLGYNYGVAMKRRFADAQREAQREGRGIWPAGQTVRADESTATR
jgi:endonuclease YncB( thermonuclease family)